MFAPRYWPKVGAVVVVVATPYAGKYAEEHAMALSLIADAQDFAAEHAMALELLQDAGR
jgi:hypothetical protein